MQGLHQIDLNCDLGEGTHERPQPDQSALFPYLTSCNIACGFHGGDPLFIENAIRLAVHYGLRIGAHPSYPDRANFGRQHMELPAPELRAMIRYQVAALNGMVENLGGRVAYVKPHGALYHTMLRDEKVAATVMGTLLDMDERLVLMGLANSPLSAWAAQAGLSFIAEAFADRRYTSDGQLAPRSQPGAVIHEPEVAVRQAHQIVVEGQVMSLEGKRIRLKADSLCIHGDNPAAVDILKALDEHFRAHNILKRAL
jgi:5-oxoprolinase (ATP-hydrolysing) subunit A